VAKEVREEPRKPYSVPQLTIYGKASELTKARTSGKFPDGGHFPKNKATAV